MPQQTFDVPLTRSPMGTHRFVRVSRFGPQDARPKVYIHAGLHADETPGMLVLQHLLRRLETADARGEVVGQVVVIPFANPIGLAQFLNGEHLGRFDLSSGSNFNRDWPDLATPVAERIEKKLGSDGEENKAIIRGAMHEVLDAYPLARELDSLRVTLARHACDADMVLDLHCDDEALAHVFLMSSQWPQISDLAGELGCRAVLWADNAGSSPFASSMSLPWMRFASVFPDYPVPPACISATVELRGYADVNDELAEADANALFRVLQRHGYVDGDPGAAPPVVCEPASMEACDIVRAPVAGIVAYRAPLGASVSRGDAIAEVVELSSAGSEGIRHPVYAATDGVVLSRRLRKLVAAGEVIAKVAGAEPLVHRQSHLLED